MRVRSPVGEVRVGSTSGARLRGDLRGKIVGIVNDDFGGDYFQHMRELLVKSYGAAQVHYWRKPSNSAPAPPSLIDEVASKVDAAIVGLAA